MIRMPLSTLMRATLVAARLGKIERDGKGDTPRAKRLADIPDRFDREYLT